MSHSKQLRVPGNGDAQQAHEERLAAAYTAYRPAIRRFVARLVGETEAEDVAQETFVRALRSLGEVRNEGALRPWLYRIATNVALDRLRSPFERRLSTSPFDEARLVAEGSPLARCPRPSIEAEAARGEMSACIRAIVDRLPGTQRLTLLLSEYEGLSDAEIAAVLGVTVGSVKIRLHRARARLRRELDSSCRIYTDHANDIACEPLVPLSTIVRRS